MFIKTYFTRSTHFGCIKAQLLGLRVPVHEDIEKLNIQGIRFEKVE